MAQLVARWSNYPMGPGFESQAHQNFVVFFIQVFRHSIPNVVHHRPQAPMRQVVPDPDQGVQDEIHHEPWSTNVQAI